jgi:Novel toxin 17
MRDAGSIGLPYKRNVYRYIPPRNYNPEKPLPKGPGGGFLDRFGNEWVQGRPHGRAASEGDDHEWDVQLSQKGFNVWGERAKTERGKSWINVTKDGWLSH